MSQVQTTLGLMDISQLEIKDVITVEPNARIVATEWFYNGTLVRRDVNVNILHGLDLINEQEKI